MAADDQQGKRFGEFVIEVAIADGPLGTVYKARRQEQPCALKVLKDSVLPSKGGHRKKLARFLQRLSLLDHPMVVKVLDGGERDGRFYVAMELMECPTLAQRLAEEGQLPEGEVVAIGRNVAQALAAGVAADICHGHLTLENIFVAGRNKVKVGDFAIRKYLQEEPSDAAAGVTGPYGGPSARPEEVAYAEELLRSRVRGGISEELRQDLAALAVAMMSLLGISVPAQEADEDFDVYCERLRAAGARLSVPPYSVSVTTLDVIYRLLTRDGFKGADDAVSELASAVVLRRTAGRTPSAGPPAAKPEGPAAPQVEAPEGELRGPAEAEQAGTPGVVLLWRSEERGEFFVLKEGQQLVLGRDPYLCDLVVTGSSTSRKHCTMRLKRGELQLKDNDTYHGTFVNGVRTEAATLVVGDTVRVGDTRITIGAALPQS